MPFGEIGTIDAKLNGLYVKLRITKTEGRVLFKGHPPKKGSMVRAIHLRHTLPGACVASWQDEAGKRWETSATVL